MIFLLSQKVFAMSDFLDLSSAGKALSVVTHPPPKQVFIRELLFALSIFCQNFREDEITELEEILRLFLTEFLSFPRLYSRSSKEGKKA